MIFDWCVWCGWYVMMCDEMDVMWYDVDDASQIDTIKLNGCVIIWYDVDDKCDMICWVCEMVRDIYEMLL